MIDNQPRTSSSATVNADHQPSPSAPSSTAIVVMNTIHSHQSRLSSTSDQRPSSPAMIHAIFSKVPQKTSSEQRTHGNKMITRLALPNLHTDKHYRCDLQRNYQNIDHTNALHVGHVFVCSWFYLHTSSGKIRQWEAFLVLAL